MLSAHQKIPQHIAIIMDGNGRWANRRGLPRIAGHRRGVEAVRQTVRGCAELKVGYLTLFAFSSENWRRPRSEVSLLTELLIRTLESEVGRLADNDIRLRVIGELEPFGRRVVDLVKRAEERTKENAGLNLTVAVNYGGRWDIARACRVLAEKIERGELSADGVTESAIEAHLTTVDLPEPDLFVRTGGEQRISNYLLWQLAYTELYFTDTLWPEFDHAALNEAIASFGRRQRRFGRTGEQIAANS